MCIGVCMLSVVLTSIGKEDLRGARGGEAAMYHTKEQPWLVRYEL